MNNTHLYAEQSPHLDELFKAHAAFLGDSKNAPRTCKSNWGRYADLATLIDTARPGLSKHGLSVTQTFVPFGEAGVARHAQPVPPAAT